MLSDPKVWSAAVAVLLAVLGYLFGFRKNRADVASVTVATAISLMGQMRIEMTGLQAQIDIQRTRIDKLERRDRTKQRRINHLEDGVQHLTAQVLELGHHPVWPPPTTAPVFPDDEDDDQEEDEQ